MLIVLARQKQVRAPPASSRAHTHNFEKIEQESMHALPRILIVAAFVVALTCAAASSDARRAASSSAQVPYGTVTVADCRGINCNYQCSARNLSTSTCYHDRRTRRAVSLHCVRRRNATCVTGVGFLDPQCGTQCARNSMMCSSCVGGASTGANRHAASTHRGVAGSGPSIRYDCDAIDHLLVQHSNCSTATPCADCRTTVTLPLDRCMANPDGMVGSYWVRLGAFTPCGLLAVERHYEGPTCTGAYVESGVPSRFCAASSDFMSRMVTCQEQGGGDGEDDDEGLAGGGVRHSEPVQLI